MYCNKCGKQIADEAVVCPGCGCAVEKNVQAQPTVVAVPKKAKTAFVFGILSLLLLAPLGIPAIILAVQSKAETGGVMCSKAKSGFVCGIIGLCWWGLSLLLWLGGV